MPMNLYAHPDSSATKKILVASNYAGLDVEVPKAAVKETGKFPVLETTGGCIFASQAIARYVSRISRTSGLYGQNVLEGGLIDSWTEFCTHELEVPLVMLLQSAKGGVPADVVSCATADVNKALTVLNNHLLHNTFMVGHQITLADINLYCTLAEGMAVLEVKPFGNLMRWFNFCSAQSEFSKVIGKVAAGGAAPKAAAAKKEAAPKAAAAGKASPKSSPKAKPAAAPAAVPAVGGDVTALGDKIRDLKAKLKADGLSGKKIDAHEDVKALVAQLQAAKEAAPAAAPAAPAAKGKASPKASPKTAPKAEPKKDAKGGKKDDAPAAKTPEQLAEDKKKKEKKVIKEGGKRGVEIEGAADMGGLQFFCTSVDEPEGDLELMDTCMKAMNQENKPDEEERKGCSGHIGKMIFSAGVDQLGVVAYLPKDLESKCDAIDWIKKVLALFQGEVAKGSTKAYAKGFIKANSDKNVFPLKIKEPCITEAITYLKGKGLFPDGDDDSDEMVFGDDDFPSI